MPWLCNKGDVSEPGVVVLCWGGCVAPSSGQGKAGVQWGNHRGLCKCYGAPYGAVK